VTAGAALGLLGGAAIVVGGTGGAVLAGAALVGSLAWGLANLPTTTALRSQLVETCIGAFSEGLMSEVPASDFICEGMGAFAGETAERWE
jgi:hypothetical protein